MFFCTRCGTLLMLEVGDKGNEFKCHRCQYAMPIAEGGPVSERLYFTPKEARGEEAAQVEADTTEATCSECFNDKAYFVQVQTRSGDEAMSIFYTCTKCRHRWRE